MKKLFTLAAFVLSSMSLMAKDYSGNLNVVVPSQNVNTTQTASITVNKQDDGNYELIIKDFTFAGMEIGTIDVKGIEATANKDLQLLSYSGSADVLANSTGGGNLVGKPVSLTLKAKLKDAGLNTQIDIVAMSDLNVKVNFASDGSDAQIPNSDFEITTNKTKEPRYWHSFPTADGNFASMVNYDQINVIEEHRPNSKGTHCVKLNSYTVPIFNKSANGTFTTGRMTAGSSDATNTANHAYIDFSQSDTDKNGDPFNAKLSTKPDAIEVWVKFAQGKKSSTHPYASIKAVITDGTYYQDPEPADAEYSNIYGTASNGKIAVTDNAWKLISVPFSYTSNEVTPKAILVTISTNAYPGGGTKDQSNKKQDILYVDDLRLIYNAGIKSVKFGDDEIAIDATNHKGYLFTNTRAAISADDFTVTSDGIGAYVEKEYDATNGILTITVTSNDLTTTNTYKVFVNPKDAVVTTKDYGYATYTADIPVKYPTADKLKAYAVKYDKSTQKLSVNEITGTVRADVPVLLRAEKQGVKDYTLKYSTEEPVEVNTDLLSSDGNVTGDEYTIYVFGKGKEGIGFFYLADGHTLPARKCYLRIEEEEDSEAKKFFPIENEATGINKIENDSNSSNMPVYNLAGQRVNNSYKGIVIKEGKKYLNK